MEVVNEVANIKEMMNPGLTKHFGPDAHVNQVVNVSQPLHFQFQRANNGRAIVRTKATALDSEQWSETFLPLKCANNKLNAPVADHR